MSDTEPGTLSNEAILAVYDSLDMAWTPIEWVNRIVDAVATAAKVEADRVKDAEIARLTGEGGFNLDTWSDGYHAAEAKYAGLVALASEVVSVYCKNNPYGCMKRLSNELATLEAQE